MWRPEIRYVFYCSAAYFQDRVCYLEPTTFLTLQDPLVSAPWRWDYRHSLCKMPFPTGPNLAFKGYQGTAGFLLSALVICLPSGQRTLQTGFKHSRSQTQKPHTYFCHPAGSASSHHYHEWQIPLPTCSALGPIVLGRHYGEGGSVGERENPSQGVQETHSA